MDYTNWDYEREALKTEIYKELREQRDRVREATDSGKIEINPQLATVDIPFEYGPFFFKSPFKQAPNMTFAQARTVRTSPFWALLDISRWESPSGALEGFYIGVLALRPPPAAVFTHSISWIAQGEASVYHPSNSTNAWMDQYSDGTNPTLEITQ